MRFGIIEKYKKYLPVSSATPIITLHEGDTPLIRSEWLSKALGGTVYLKYEGMNPTGSFKDRGMTLAVSKAKEAGARVVICASTGNTSASAAAYAARAGLRCVVLIPKGAIALGKLSQALIHGAQVLAVDGNFDDEEKGLLSHLASQTAIAIENLKNAFGKEKQDGEIEGIARRVFENLCRNAVELVNFPKINKANIDRRVKVENIGIIVMALGLGVVASINGSPVMAGLAFAGALLHVLNHSLFKGLLFMGAGAVLHGAGTAELEALGGLGKRMPRTAAFFLAGAASACALPPFNGFAGEFLIYLGAFKALGQPGPAGLAGVIAGLSLAAAGALAAAAFSRAAGTAFLGEPRTEMAARAHEAGPLMLFSMGALALLCLLSGLAGPFLLLPVGTASAAAFGLPPALAAAASAAQPLAGVAAGFLVLLAMIAFGAVKRKVFLRGKTPAQGLTWDCGYAAPTARMQYGASSFAQPLTDFFQPVLRKIGQYPVITEYFPARASFSREAQAVFYNSVYRPVAVRIRDLAYRFSWIQHGRLQLYILYIVVTLILLLLWKL